MGKIRHRTSLQDIADHLGLHVSSVSLALRQDPRMRSETIAQVQAAAVELGYRANPYVSAWMRHVRDPERAQDGAGLALILGSPTNQRAIEAKYYQSLLLGARKEALRLGFNLVDYGFDDTFSNLDKALRSMTYRGIRGVLIYDPTVSIPGEVLARFEEHFATVVMLRTGTNRFHSVASDAVGNMEMALARLGALGCRRIGLPSSGRLDALSSFNRRNASTYLLAQAMLPAEDRLPLVDDVHPPSKDSICVWLKKYRPDGIISLNPWLHSWLVDFGVRIPEDLRYALIGTEGHMGVAGVTGVDTRGEDMGRASVFKLASLLSGNFFGVPDCPQLTLISGRWVDGETA